jgi:hypothetical protein
VSKLVATQPGDKHGADDEMVAVLRDLLGPGT